jgi:hypothetical protein
MSGLFGGPKVPSPLPVVNPADAQNRVNDALLRRLASGGTNADNVANTVAPTAAPHAPTLTGLG